jgi:hypothetical protein
MTPFARVFRFTWVLQAHLVVKVRPEPVTIDGLPATAAAEEVPLKPSMRLQGLRLREPGRREMTMGLRTVDR